MGASPPVEVNVTEARGGTLTGEVCVTCRIGTIVTWVDAELFCESTTRTVSVPAFEPAT
jgi:hypothetical protein